MGRRAAAALLITAALALAAGVGALVAVSQGWQRERVRAWAERALTDALGSPVHIGAVEGPLHADFVVRDLRLGSPAVEVASIRVRVGGVSRTPPHLVIDALEVRGLDAVLETETADDAAEDPADEEGSGWEPTVLLRSALLSEASLVLLRGEDRLELRVEGEAGPWRLAGEDAALLPERLSGQARVVPGSRISGRPVRSGSARFSLETGRVEVPELVLHAGELELSGSGSTRVEPWLEGRADPDARLELAFRALDPAAFGAPAWSASDLTGSLSAAPDPARSGAWTARGELGPGRLPVGAIDGGAFAAAYHDERFVLESLNLSGPDLRVRASGAADPESLHDLRVEGALPLERLAPLLDAPLRGDAKLELEATGRFDALEGSLAARVGALGIGEHTLGDLTLAARSSEPGAFRIEQLSLRGEPAVRLVEPTTLKLAGGSWQLSASRWTGPFFELELEGGVGPDGFEALRVEFVRLDLAGVSPWLDEPSLAGAITGELRLAGALARPRVEGEIRGRSVTVESLTLDSLQAVLSSSEEAVLLDGSVEAGSSGSAEIRARVARDRLLEPGAWPGDPATRAVLDAENLDLALLGPLLPEGVSDPAGRATAHLELEGARPKPALSGEIVLSDARLSLAEPEAQLRVARGDLALRGDRVRVDDWEIEILRAREEGAPETLTRIAARGVVSLERLENLEVSGRDVEAKALGRLLGARPRLGGSLDFDLVLDGPLDAPRARGRLDWSAPRIDKVELDALALRLEPGARGDLDASVDLHLGGAPILHATATIPGDLSPVALEALAEHSRFRADLEADAVDLSVFAPFLPVSLRAPAGRATGRVRIAGTAGGPQLDGFLELNDAGVRARVLGERLEPLNGRLRFEGDRVVVESLEIRQDEGVARLEGSLALADPTQTARMALHFDDFALRRPPLFQTRISGDTTLSGSLAEPAVEGSLRFERLEVYIPAKGDRALKEIRIVTGPNGSDDPTRISEATDRSEWWSNTRVDVRAEVAPGAHVEGSGASLYVAGEVRVEKERGGELHYTGQAAVSRGSYTGQGHRFDVKTGKAMLTGSTELDPLLDVEAVTRVRDVQILVRLTGPASNPNIAFESEPPMQEADVLSYLLFGRPTGDLGFEQQQAVSAAALSYAAGMASRELSGVLRRVGIDALDVRSGADGSTTQIGVTKYISERASMRYGTGVGADPESEVEVEVELTPSIRVRSSVGSSGSAGADVIWTRDY